MANPPLHKVKRADARAHLRRTLELLATGMRWRDALRAAHLAPRTWTRHAIRLGLPCRVRGRRQPDSSLITRAKFLRLLDQGLTYRSAARQLGISHGGAGGLLRTPLRIPTGPCPFCGAPATDNHHVLYVPEIVIHLCRPCHLRYHARARKPRR